MAEHQQELQKVKSKQPKWNSSIMYKGSTFAEGMRIECSRRGIQEKGHLYVILYNTIPTPIWLNLFLKRNIYRASHSDILNKEKMTVVYIDLFRCQIGIMQMMVNSLSSNS